jgi:hypothetical protein
MIKRHNYIALSILLIALWSCSSLEKSTTVNLEIFKPAKLEIPADKQNIGIIYRNPVAVKDTVDFINVSENFEDSTGIYAINPYAFHYIETFRQLLKDSKRFNRIEIISIDAAEDQLTDSFKIRDITLDDVTRIGVQNPLVDIFLFSDYINQQIFSYYYREISEFTLVAYTYSVWQMAGISNDSLTYHYFKTDTLWWKGYANSQKELHHNFPSEQQAKIEGAEEAALSFSKLFIPYWEVAERRMYLSGNYEMKIAQKYALNNQWIEAADIWKRYTNNKNKGLAAKAMFNMALASEVYGELEGAIDWAIKSYMVYNEMNTIHSNNTKDYINKLVARKKDYEMLDKAIRIPGNQ